MKMSKMKKIKIGDKITVSKHPDATWFSIVSIGPGPMITIKEGDLYRDQNIDICQVCRHKKRNA